MQIQKNNPFDLIYTLIMTGIQSWFQAGELVTKELEKNPDFPDQFHDKFPEISPDYILAFDRIGRKEWHPKLTFSNSAGVLRLRKLPYSLQEKYIQEPVPLLIRKEKGVETLMVSVFNLTPDQARQVFAVDHIRTEAEQRAWMEDKSSKTMIEFDEPYRISKRTLVIMQPCTLTAKQIAGLLAQME